MMKRILNTRIPVSLVVVAFLALMFWSAKPAYAQGDGNVTQAVTDPTKTFVISFAIGTSGAFVYLFVLLMTDRTLSILRNDMLPLWAMVFLYTISGGIVAGITQTATGSGISANNVQNVFMVGFGWQGVIAGAGGSSKVSELKDTEVEFKKLLGDLSG